MCQNMPNTAKYLVKLCMGLTYLHSVSNHFSIYGKPESKVYIRIHFPIWTIQSKFTEF